MLYDFEGVWAGSHLNRLFPVCFLEEETVGLVQTELGSLQSSSSNSRYVHYVAGIRQGSVGQRGIVHMP